MIVYVALLVMFLLLIPCIAFFRKRGHGFVRSCLEGTLVFALVWFVLVRLLTMT